MEYLKEDEILFYEELCSRPYEETELIKYTKLFRENIKLANYVALKISRKIPDHVIELDDLLQEAYLGLWLACMRYDESKGLAFSTFAVPTIEFTIKRVFRDHTPIKVSRSFYQLDILCAKKRFSKPLSPEEMEVLVEESGYSLNVIKSYNNFSPTPLSLNYLMRDEDSDSDEYDIPDDDTQLEEELFELDLDDIVEKLLTYVRAEKDKDMIEEWLYSTIEGTPCRQEELAKKYHMSQPHVSRMLRTFIMDLQKNKTYVLSLFGR